MYQKIKKIYSFIEKNEKIIIGALFLILCLITFYTIINRAAGGVGLPWLTELSKSVLITTTYICGCVAVSEGKLTKLSLVPDALSKKMSMLLKAVTDLASSLFMFWLGIVCVENILSLKKVGMMMVTLGIQTYILYVPMAVGMFGMALRLLLLCGEDIYGFMKTGRSSGKITSDEKVKELMEKGE